MHTLQRRSASLQTRTSSRVAVGFNMVWSIARPFPDRLSRSRPVRAKPFYAVFQPDAERTDVVPGASHGPHWRNFFLLHPLTDSPATASTKASISPLQLLCGWSIPNPHHSTAQQCGPDGSPGGGGGSPTPICDDYGFRGFANHLVRHKAPETLSWAKSICWSSSQLNQQIRPLFASARWPRGPRNPNEGDGSGPPNTVQRPRRSLGPSAATPPRPPHHSMTSVPCVFQAVGSWNVAMLPRSSPFHV